MLLETFLLITGWLGLGFFALFLIVLSLAVIASVCIQRGIEDEDEEP